MLAGWFVSREESLFTGLNPSGFPIIHQLTSVTRAEVRTKIPSCSYPGLHIARS
jgi:hypothetical protein